MSGMRHEYATASLKKRKHPRVNKYSPSSALSESDRGALSPPPCPLPNRQAPVFFPLSGMERFIYKSKFDAFSFQIWQIFIARHRQCMMPRHPRCCPFTSTFNYSSLALTEMDTLSLNSRLLLTWRAPQTGPTCQPPHGLGPL